MNGSRPARRLLFLLPFAPRLDGVHGGSRSLGQLLGALADRHRLAVLYLRGAGEPGMDDRLRARCDLVEEIARDSRGARGAHVLRRANRVLALMRGMPPWAAEWHVPAYGERVRALAREWRPEIVQLEFHVMGQYASALGPGAAPRVLVQHEPGAAAARDRGALQRGLPRLRSRLEVRAWVRYERAVMGEVEAVVVFTDHDRQVLGPIVAHTPIVRIPLGIEIPDRPLDPLGSSPLRLAFVGNFVHPPNTDAAVRLIGHIFPRLRQQFPELILSVVGENPPDHLRSMADSCVHVTGRVPDVRPYLDTAAVAVMPLRLGGGMRVKVLEALAAGKAVVASPRAAEGLDVVDGEHLVLAESDQEFCEAIAGLLRDPAGRAALARRARAWACANLGWEKVVASYEALYTSLITKVTHADVPPDVSRGAVH